MTETNEGVEGFASNKVQRTESPIETDGDIVVIDASWHSDGTKVHGRHRFKQNQNRPMWEYVESAELEHGFTSVQESGELSPPHDARVELAEALLRSQDDVDVVFDYNGDVLVELHRPSAGRDEE